MHLYHLTLQGPTAIHQAVYGNFSAPRAQEMVVARGRFLELLRPDESGKMQTVCSVDTFSTIRKILPFRLTAGNRDYVVVGSDSGRIVILLFEPKTQTFERVHQETYGKTGCRRVVPGQYLAADPKGRAIMIAAVEKQKFVYVMNRDASARLTISSPLEAHKSHMLTFDIIGVDVGLENPIFACLELDYSNVDSDSTGETAEEVAKFITFYELDLGLNNVVRKWTEETERSANMLVAVPGGADGPGGVLVCAENLVSYHRDGHTMVQALFPRRASLGDEEQTLIVCHATHKQRDLFFFLAQTEHGDLFKITLQHSEGKVTDLRVKYFDTVPIASSLCITKTGLLFLAAESGNHMLYQFQGIGDDDDVTAETHALPPNLEDLPEEEFERVCATPLFEPRKQTNLAPVDEMQSLAPALGMLVANATGEETPQLYSLCGRARRSTLRSLRYGLGVSQLAASDLGGVPTNLWTVRERHGAEKDALIVISFTDATLVLSVGETVEEVSNSGLQGDAATLCVQLLENDSMVQVTRDAMFLVRANAPPSKWAPPGHKYIEHADANERQVVLALTGGELCYFELGPSGDLEEPRFADTGGRVTDVALGDIPPGQLRSAFMAATGARDLRVLSLDPANVLTPLAVQPLTEPPISVCMATMAHSMCAMAAAGGADEDAASEGAVAAGSSTYVVVGLENGLHITSQLDTASGKLNNPRTRLVGTRGVKLVKTRVDGRRALLALSSRAWLSYSRDGKLQMTPLSYEPLSCAAPFASDPCPEGVVAVAGSQLHILTVDGLGAVFNQKALPLRHTPRRVAHVPASPFLVVVEADHNALTATDEAKRASGMEEEEEGGKDGENGSSKPLPPDQAVTEHAKVAAEATTAVVAYERDEEAVAEAQRVEPPHAGAAGRWASMVRLVNTSQNKTVSAVPLPRDQAALCVATCAFHDRGGEVFVVVGCARRMQLHPRKSEGGVLRVYRLFPDETRGSFTFVLTHETEVDEAPSAMCQFRGRLLVGMGATLRLYDMGRRKLLRKCELRGFPNLITGIKTQPDSTRAYVSDVAESVHFVKYSTSDNRMTVFADDVTPRYMTAFDVVDADTVAGGDKFGNVFVLRLPEDVADDVFAPSGGQMLWDQGKLNGAENKVDAAAHFHVGEVVTGVQRIALSPGAREVVVYTTITGAVGAFLPFTTRADVDLFTQLQLHLRNEHLSLTGRDHFAYRSSFVPVRNVVDGDLCERLAALPADRQRRVAQEMDMTVPEVVRKLEELRAMML